VTLLFSSMEMDKKKTAFLSFASLLTHLQEINTFLIHYISTAKVSGEHLKVFGEKKYLFLISYA